MRTRTVPKVPKKRRRSKWAIKARRIRINTASKQSKQRTKPRRSNSRQSSILEIRLTKKKEEQMGDKGKKDKDKHNKQAEQAKNEAKKKQQPTIKHT